MTCSLCSIRSSTSEHFSSLRNADLLKLIYQFSSIKAVAIETYHRVRSYATSSASIHEFELRCAVVLAVPSSSYTIRQTWLFLRFHKNRSSSYSITSGKSQDQGPNRVWTVPIIIREEYNALLCETKRISQVQ